MSIRSRWLVALALPLLALVGCDDGTDTSAKAPPPKPKAADGKRVKVGDNVYLEVMPNNTRRVVVEAEVCLREGPLEQLLTRKNRKEHEAILAADIDARKLHEALVLAKAKEGSPVRWVPAYRPPEGTAIKISLVYEDKKGKKVTAAARSWIKNRADDKELASDWVFAGSQVVDSENPLDGSKTKHYLANDGDVICIANFESALLDVPMKSSKADDDRGYDAWTDRIPPVGTKVTVILEPVEKAK